MRALCIIGILLAAGAAHAQEAPPAETTAALESPVVVVVESSRASVRADAMRTALREALGAPVVALEEAPETPRARMSIVVLSDSSARVHIALRRGVEAATTIEPGAVVAGPAFLAALAERVAAFLTATESDLSLRMNAHSGLIAWEEEGLRPYPEPHRVRPGALLPWPQNIDDGQAAPPEAQTGSSNESEEDAAAHAPRTREARPSVERASDLSAPPPGRTVRSFF